MFKKLFDKIDNFIENFNEITNLDQVVIEVLHLIEKIFSDNNNNMKKKGNSMNCPLCILNFCYYHENKSSSGRRKPPSSLLFVVVAEGALSSQMPS